MNGVDYLDLNTERKIAYRRIAARAATASASGPEPGIVFLGGFKSDMTGTKALWLEGWARERGRAFLRFDYRGHGASSGRFEDGTIGDWADDAYQAVTRLTEGPQILVGSSMGGWIALLLARRMPDRIAGLIGIAPAPDFTEDLIWARMDPADRRRLETDGRIEHPSAYSDAPFVYTQRLIEEGRRNLVLRSPLPLPFPVRLLHGSADTDVPPSVALRLFEHLQSPDARLTLAKDADHRFSGPRELALIGKAVHGVTMAARDPGAPTPRT